MVKKCINFSQCLKFNHFTPIKLTGTPKGYNYSENRSFPCAQFPQTVIKFVINREVPGKSVEWAAQVGTGFSPNLRYV